MRALDAVDDWMTATAAAAGWSYDVTWRTDRPQRPAQLPSGADAAQCINRTPPAVLWGVKEGGNVPAALMYGHHRLATVFGSEAHDIWRQVSRDRVTT